MRILRHDYKRRIVNEYFSWSYGFDIRTITDDIVVEIIAETTYRNKRVLIQIKRIRSKEGIDWVETKTISIFGDRAEKSFKKIAEFFKNYSLGVHYAENH